MRILLVETNGPEGYVQAAVPFRGVHAVTPAYAPVCWMYQNQAELPRASCDVNEFGKTHIQITLG